MAPVKKQVKSAKKAPAKRATPKRTKKSTYDDDFVVSPEEIEEEAAEEMEEDEVYSSAAEEEEEEEGEVGEEIEEDLDEDEEDAEEADFEEVRKSSVKKPTSAKKATTPTRKAPPAKRQKKVPIAENSASEADEEEEEDDARETARVVRKLNLKQGQIIDLATQGEGRRLKGTTKFELGGSYLIQLGPADLFSGGGTFDAFQIGKFMTPKKGGKKASEPELVKLNLPVRLLPKLQKAMATLLDQFTSKRTLPSLEATRERRAGRKNWSMDLSPYSSFVAPNTTIRLDGVHYVGGETVDLGKGNSFEAITFARKSNAKASNGKPSKPFTMHLPLRYLELIAFAVDYSCREVGGANKKTDD